MKVLSLAHDCTTETFKDKDGNPKKFYNGPSPDEVALVQFASDLKFDCTANETETIRLQVSDANSNALTELSFEVFCKM